MENGTASPPILIATIREGAPVPRARETLARLLVLFGIREQAPASPKEGPRLTLLKGGKVDPPDVA